MFLLTVTIVIFIIVIGLIIYSNMPQMSSGVSCGKCGGGGCGSCPCNRCGAPRKQCGCGNRRPDDCPFC